MAIITKRINSSTSSSSIGIRGRLRLGFATLAVIIAATVCISLTFISYASKYAYHTIDSDLPIFSTLFDLGGQIYAAQAAVGTYVIIKDKADENLFRTLWKNINLDVTIIDGLINSINNQSYTNKWQNIKSHINDLLIIQNKIISSTDNISSPAIKTLFLDQETAINNIQDILDGKLNDEGQRVGGLYDIQQNVVDSGTQSILSNLKQIESIQYLLLFAVVLVSFLIAHITAKLIINPIISAINIAKKISEGSRNISIDILSKDETGELLLSLDEMQKAILDNEIKIRDSELQSRTLYENLIKSANLFSKHSSNVAMGDLRHRISLNNDDILSQLGNDLNTMTESLSNITKNIIQSSVTMSQNLIEVKQAVESQSSGASEQASSINQITASLDEIEKSSSQTMEKARTLGLSAERTREKSQKGIEAVNLSMQGMKLVREKVQTIANTILELSELTQQVGEITSAVNNLSQQSKMLALNASIEAAKAGEAGKGFAIVAAEVKNLAEQSEHSTKQVQKILEDIKHATEKAVMVTEEGVKGVDEGAILVEQTGDIIHKLSDVIKEASISTQQIEAAVRQESVGIEQITVGMNEINQVTAAFVASSKQTSDAINSLSIIANKIKQSVETYKISQE